MIKRVYTVKDIKANQIGPLIVVNSEPEIMRSLDIEISDNKSLLGRYPEDFALLYLGEIDLSSGDLALGKSIINPSRVGLVSDLVGAK